ncbi:MAG TPA: MazG nucleotide pyrophosphohydrolase domain-containing protein, partial [Acidimicrobiales bacterium]|nr:MazG nucleotide pyrophosphohydrolase domain-containing protein [Acidimicrobiales bacterium]
HSRLAAEEGRFTVADVARSLHDKLVSRHPHVFGEVAAHDAATVVANWEELKKREKGRESVTDGIPAALPSLTLAAKLQRKSASVPGAAMPEADVLAAGARAVLDALAHTVADGGPSGVEAGASPSTGDVGAAAARAGALLWAVTDLVRRAGVEPEDALRAEAGRFADHLRSIERRADGDEGGSGARPERMRRDVRPPQ